MVHYWNYDSLSTPYFLTVSMMNSWLFLLSWLEKCVLLSISHKLSMMPIWCLDILYIWSHDDAILSYFLDLFLIMRIFIMLLSHLSCFCDMIILQMPIWCMVVAHEYYGFVTKHTSLLRSLFTIIDVMHVSWCKDHAKADVVIIVKFSRVWTIGIKPCHVCNPIILGDWCKLWVQYVTPLC